MPKKTKKNPPPLSRAITHYRKQRNLTMQQLGDLVGVTESYISFLESGVRSPSRKLIKKLIDYFYPQGNPELLDEWLMLAGFAPISLRKSPPPTPSYQIHLKRLEKDPKDLRSLFALTRAMIRAGKFKQAEDKIQASFQQFQNSVEIQSLVGSLELARGNYDQAIIAQKAALDIYTLQDNTAAPRLSETDLLLSLGVSQFLKGYHQLADYHQHLEHGPAKQAQALKKQIQNNLNSAAETFSHALKRDDNDIYILDEYGRVLFNQAQLAAKKSQAKLWQETIATYERVLRHPENPLIGKDALLDTAVFLGHAHSKAGQFEQAANVLSLTQALRPDAWLGHYARACQLSLQADNAYEQDNYLDQALHHLNRACQISPDQEAKVEARFDPDLATLRKARPEAFLACLENGK